MCICDACNKEVNFSFICPDCGGHFCKEHRKPEHHNCQKRGTPYETSVEEQTAPVPDPSNIDHPSVEEQKAPSPALEPSNDDHAPESETNKFYNLEEILFTEKNVPAPKSHGVHTKGKTQTKKPSLVAQLNAIKTPLAILMIIAILSGSLIGALVIPSGDTDNLQQRYDTLLEYYTELQADNQDLNLVIENRDYQISSLQTELDVLSQEHSALQNDWDSLFSDQTQYEAPSINQLTSWLAADSTDQHTISSTYSPVDQAILLSLEAKNQKVKLGVITVYGNFTEEFTEYTYNVVETEGGGLVYIDPQTDEIWWTLGYEEISPDRIWNLGKYVSVHVTEVDTIITPWIS